MCQVSDKFKLCTCSKAELENAEAVWKLFSPRPESEITHVIIGELILPAEIDPLQNQQNQANILKRLSEADVFDFQPDLKDGDLLVLSFKSAQTGYADRAYSYSFYSGKWEPDDENYFERETGYSGKKSGKVFNPF